VFVLDCHDATLGIIGAVRIVPAGIHQLGVIFCSETRGRGEDVVAPAGFGVGVEAGKLVPIVHNTTYDALREVSPMLASRNGLDTAEMPMADVAAKLAELVAL
jgi:hypothetical protein